MATLRCRPSESEKEPIMTFMSAPQMLGLKLKNGDLCSITWKDQSATAVVWLTSKSDLKEGVIGVSRWLQDRCGIKLENKVNVEKSTVVLQDTDIVPIRLVEGEMDEEQKSGWAFNASLVVCENYRFLVPGQKFFVVAGKQKKEIEVLGSTKTEHDIYRIGASTRAIFQGLSEVNGVGHIPGTGFDQIGGLHYQKRLLKRRARQVSSPDSTPNWYPTTVGAHGILLWGPPGTGKTLLRKAIESEISWKAVHNWPSATRTAVVSAKQPQLIHVDILNKPTEQEATKLLHLFQETPSSTLIAAEIRDPNDLPSFLRTGSTFTDEIEVSVPDVSARTEILSILSQNSLVESFIEQAATRTHGFVGGDLLKLLREIFDQVQSDIEDNNADKDIKDNDHPPINGNDSNSNGNSGGTTPLPTTTHLTSALLKIRPSALQSVIFSKPNIKWTDIGGQTQFKARLQNAVEWPLKHPQKLQAYNLTPTKGILLYGPPGCSKTMLVRALATESDHNFLAVKGAELISMYVGESERAIREVFRKARAASPCIVFFDEIDAIARRASGSSELNVLTTLLNEMDGFDKLKDVFVVAATNKPQTIDSALLRPGRFDNAVYIGPPDEVARREIFVEQFARVKYIRVDVRATEVIDGFVERTEGFSGADVVSICQQAGEIAFKRGLEYGFETEEAMIRSEDVDEAIVRTPRSITTDMLKEYQDWNASRGR